MKIGDAKNIRYMRVENGTKNICYIMVGKCDIINIRVGCMRGYDFYTNYILHQISVK